MKKRFSNYLIILLSLVTVLGCGVITKTRLTFPFDLMVSLDDLPDGFVYQGSELSKVDEAIALAVTYGGGAEEPGKCIRHQIAVYPDTTSAQAGYPGWEKQRITDGWTDPAESSFQPRHTDDRYSLHCMTEVQEDGHSRNCKWLQLHKNLVIAIDVLINDEAQMNLAAFEAILASLDARLPVEAIPMPETDNRALFDFK
jgi:hypothetical protein